MTATLPLSRKEWYVILSHEAFEENETNVNTLDQDIPKEKSIKPHLLLFWLSVFVMVGYAFFSYLGNQVNELAMLSIFIMAMAAYFKVNNP